MSTSAFIPVPKEPTVEEAKRFVSVDHILIPVSSTVTRQGDIEHGGVKHHVTVKTVAVTKESEMKPELVMAGPKRRGEVNVYVGIDGRRHYFSAKTGEAIGSQMRRIASGKSVDIFPPLGATR
ncbi:MAG: hypothetical protein ABSF14_18265 [Terriglobia bacterium]|jgi:hypothetical protein